ncbi:MAG TPA: transcription-repair coupling factor [Syntrophales bacterium]|nr:transcription-repair coupling factor [Syntrophales bacterium]HQI36302.1 transcription-repair coupling factor [Syntrophales bacterium]
MKRIVRPVRKSRDPVLEELLAMIDRREKIVAVRGLEGTARAFLVALLHRRLARPVLLITPTEKEARRLCSDLSFFSGAGQVLHYPAWEVVSTDLFSWQRETELSRSETLCRLLTGEPLLTVASVPAVLQKTSPREDIAAYCRRISLGDFLDRDVWILNLLQGGYHRVTLVEGKGEFAVRGHVIDLFPPTAPYPYRLEFVGDEVESIRRFDPDTQRSLREIDEFLLTPAREVIMTEARQNLGISRAKQRANELGLSRAVRDHLVERMADGLTMAINPLLLPLFYDEVIPPGFLLDYFSPGGLLIWDDSLAVARAGADLANEIDRLLMKARREERFFLDREAHYWPGDRPDRDGGNFQQLRLDNLEIGGRQEALVLRAAPPAGVKSGLEIRSGDGAVLSPLIEKLRDWVQDGYTVYFLYSGKEGQQRLARFLDAHGLVYGLPTAAGLGTSGSTGTEAGNTGNLEKSNEEEELPFLSAVSSPAENGGLYLCAGRLSGSFAYDALRLVVLSDEEVWGKKITGRRFRPGREGYFLKSFGELREGDYIVHRDYGIGRYGGLKKLVVEGVENDFLLISYLDQDRLYIPVDRLDSIQRYLGPEGAAPRLDRLGGSSWEAVKERVKKSIRETAEELMAVYAAREVMDRPPLAPPDRLYHDFCAAFEYEETPDQYRAIEDVHLDLSRGKPMDRLICGDAGFGKTEVALRAAFRTVMESRQVAVLVPTTILAEQHYQTFSRRFQPFPVRVEVLNRFRTKAEQAQIVAEIARGTVDIVVGTHRLLQKDVRFKNLGLVVIDEEQRFGVTHKEKLKKLRTLVDVLTLTATPIPRTLHLSLVGIRDLSVIHTPPEDRRPIKTHVVEFNEELIREAIREELERQGQVFFLHDRVRSIYSMARFIEKLVPRARVAVLHGQMKAGEIEATMVRFIQQQCNVLVCTTIIGSGVDIPTANTIIINRADRFGLAQLYQIRGRVGRAKEEARAYLLVPKGAMLSRDAQKRLQVIMDFSEPGAGFRIAANDLEIRGGGSLLGVSQSGHVTAVGYELYTELMEKTVRELKGESVVADEIRPEINLGIPALIPAGYMPDEQRRLVTYKRISLAAGEEDLEEIRAELADCYGFVPEEIENLLEVIRIRNLLKILKGRKMGYDGKQLVVVFQADSPIDPARIVKISRTVAKGVKLTPDFKLLVPLPGLTGRKITAAVKDLLESLRDDRPLAMVK